MTKSDATGHAILSRVRAALSRAPRTPAEPLPPALRLPPRRSGARADELALLLAEIEAVGGVTRRLKGRAEVEGALVELVESEGIRKATVAEINELQGLPRLLTRLGVGLVPPDASKQEIAQCDLGITGADAALPETGTFVLRSTPKQPMLISLLPRVHLILFQPSILYVDLAPVFKQFKHSKRLVLITGPSRTADIEKVLTLGVHGPKALYAWCVE
jgi:L-lactate dehydrogenase complex protein LldG